MLIWDEVQSNKMIKRNKLPKDVEKRFNKMWFAPRGKTTTMNWSGLISESYEPMKFLGFTILKSPYYRNADENERLLKEDLANLIKDFFADEIAKMKRGRKV